MFDLNQRRSHCGWTSHDHAAGMILQTAWLL
jgi:hypothetical protein